VAVMFFIPGISETLRIRGTAEITDNKKLLETMSIKSVTPQTALIVHIKEIYLHCAKAIVRSGIWDQKNVVKDYSTREMFSSHVGKKIDEFSDYYDNSIRSVINDEGRK
jgi:predicted pyridoxine 5'-phosphate oxidase superfamily flavin-nucleotide-binding protein